MKRLIQVLFATMILASACLADEKGPLAIEVSKDNFGRSNERNQNSGGSGNLYIAHTSALRAIVAFDLSAATNTILSAELVLTMASTNDKPASLVVAPMVFTEKNAVWKEGTGAMGMVGRNAAAGESTYSRSAFPDVAWESAVGKAATGLGDNALWLSPIARLNNQVWTDGGTIRIKIADVGLLETIRNSGKPVVTLGLWGAGGNGYYAIAAKESGKGARLVLELK